MQLIMLDTETTGLSPLHGDRMVEIGAIRVSRRKIQKDDAFHCYLNPGRPIPEEVVRIHGISDADVKDSPRFADVAEAFLSFIEGSTLVIHNASFDLGFLMNELRLADAPDIAQVPVIDSLGFARKRHPGQRNSLDALCDRYHVDRSKRTLHGALLDAELLAEVYLAMTGGRQISLDMDTAAQAAGTFVQLPESTRSRAEQAETANMVRRDAPLLDELDVKAHQEMLDRIHAESGQAIWLLPPRQS
ncbi:MAG: DNA polymerase III subunit epsilon [Mariprofundaceae bacterium]|nr:DNA polymerase III subunit epsilon [Mariprofundaceae bacterium]